jgi:hypothetical protein
MSGYWFVIELSLTVFRVSALSGTWQGFVPTLTRVLNRVGNDVALLRRYARLSYRCASLLPRFCRFDCMLNALYGAVEYLAHTASKPSDRFKSCAYLTPHFAISPTDGCLRTK